MSVFIRRSAERILILFAVLAAVFPQTAERAAAQGEASGEWPQLLGPQRNGLSTETGLLDRWPTAPQPEVPQKPIPSRAPDDAIRDARNGADALAMAGDEQWPARARSLTWANKAEQRPYLFVLNPDESAANVFSTARIQARIQTKALLQQLETGLNYTE